jgi:phosphoglycolate phosphatase
VTIRGILFDKDGTLLDYWKTWVPINREAALFAAAGDEALADELLQRAGHNPVTNHVTSGSVLAVGSHDEIAAAFAATLGLRTPANLAKEVERVFREGGGRHSVLMEGVRWKRSSACGIAGIDWGLRPTTPSVDCTALLGAMG